MRKRIKYVVERRNGTKEFYKTKKEICETYGINLACVNHALTGFPLCIRGKINIWIKESNNG